MSGLLVEKFVLTEVNDVNCYGVACAATREAMVIDPGAFDPVITAWLATRGLALRTVFLTHGHHDHTGGVEAALDYAPEATLIGAEAELPRGVTRRRVAAAGDEVRVGEHVGRLCDTSGHTPAGLSLYFPGYVFTGDALFSGSVGGTQGRELFRHQTERVARGVLSLPDDTIVHPGHGPSSTIGVERRHNSFFVA